MGMVLVLALKKFRIYLQIKNVFLQFLLRMVLILIAVGYSMMESLDLV